jgi:hypothetical protein
MKESKVYPIIEAEVHTAKEPTVAFMRNTSTPYQSTFPGQKEVSETYEQVLDVANVPIMPMSKLLQHGMFLEDSMRIMMEKIHKDFLH